MISRIIDGFIKLWRGEQPLGRAFWIYFILIWIGSMIIEVVLHKVLFYFGFAPFGLLPLLVLNLLYPFLAATGVWRSANAHEGTAFYPLAAKVAVCIILAPTVWYLVNDGLPAVAQFLASP